LAVGGRLAAGWVLLATVDLLSTAPVPPPLARSAAEAAPWPVLMLAASTQPDEVPGAEHTGGLRAQPAEWRPALALRSGTTTGLGPRLPLPP
jgi:hypothetical protein